jgi:hypothetical protein
VACALNIAYDRKAKSAAKEKANARKAAKQASRTRSDIIREAQAAFNKYIRTRDDARPCISCGKFSDARHGGAYDAGHYRSVGAAPHLRFHVLNCWRQCKRCNNQLSGNAVEYRKRLIERIGVKRVEGIEYDDSSRKFSVEYLERVKRVFTRRARLYEKLRST